MLGHPSLRPALLTVSAAVTALALTACTDHGDHDANPLPTVTTSSAVGEYTGADVTFAQGMIPHHQQALEMAELAATRAADPEVSALAQQIRRGQSPEIATMRSWLAAWGQPTAAPDHDGEHARMAGMLTDAQLTGLRGASGKQFDRMFCELMIVHHEGALAMARDLIVEGASPRAKQLAHQIADAQQAEIAKMKALLTRL